MRMSRPRLAAVALAATVAVAAPAAAQAKLPSDDKPVLIPNEGIGGVVLGQRLSTAKQWWGTGGDCSAYNCQYSDPRRSELGSAQFSTEDGRGGRVSNIVIGVGYKPGTSKPNFRTPLTAFASIGGIKLGSSQRAVKQAYPKARAISSAYGSSSYLSLVDHHRNTTIFEFNAARLIRVTIQDDRPRG